MEDDEREDDSNIDTSDCEPDEMYEDAKDLDESRMQGVRSVCRR